MLKLTGSGLLSFSDIFRYPTNCFSGIVTWKDISKLGISYVRAAGLKPVLFASKKYLHVDVCSDLKSAIYIKYMHVDLCSWG